MKLDALVFDAYGTLFDVHSVMRRCETCWPGKGAALSELLQRSPTVKEGVNASKAAVELAKRFSVDMPICQESYAVFFEHRSPREAVVSLLGRALKSVEA